MIIVRYLIAAFIICCQVAYSAPDTMVYRYWDWGKTPMRDDAQIAALKLALEKTQAEYGDFEIIREHQMFSTSRARREVNRGEIINLSAGPWRPVETTPEKISEKNLRVEIPLLNGLLGYRQLIIRKEDREKFNKIKTDSEMKQLIAGQAHGWQDVDIYKYNGYKVDDEGSATSIFPMLENHRFDYFPTSIIETHSMLADAALQGKNFIVAPDLLIYYPFPVIFYVSIHEPMLAERLEKGLKIAQQDNSLSELFNSFFKNDLITLKQKKIRYFILENPSLPETLNEHTPSLLTPKTQLLIK